MKRQGRRRQGALEAGSRERLFAAAAAEFAARGFAGANVDRIARAAHVNKAMIYYHFNSKAALYQEILGEMFHAVGERIRAVAASGATPQEKLTQFVAAIAEAAEARPHFPLSGSAIAEGGSPRRRHDGGSRRHRAETGGDPAGRHPPSWFPQGQPAARARQHRRPPAAVLCQRRGARAPAAPA